MACHPNNSNLTLHEEEDFRGLPLQPAHAPYIAEYLGATDQVLQQALDAYAKVLAFRVDLHLPPDFNGNAGEAITRFLESFKAKVEHNRRKAKQQNASANMTVVRYIWAKEIPGSGHPHFHLAFLLNYSAFSTLGQFELGHDNLFNKLVEAWASALKICAEDARGLVHIPVNGVYCLERGNPDHRNDFFHRVSYLSKASTKRYGDGGHAFGCSRG